MDNCLQGLTNLFAFFLKLELSCNSKFFGLWFFRKMLIYEMTIKEKLGSLLCVESKRFFWHGLHLPSPACCPPPCHYIRLRLDKNASFPNSWIGTRKDLGRGGRRQTPGRGAGRSPSVCFDQKSTRRPNPQSHFVGFFLFLKPSG